MIVRLREKRAKIATQHQLPSDVIIRIVDEGFDNYDNEIPEHFRYLDFTGENGTFPDGIAADNSENLKSYPGFYEYHGIRR